MRTKELTSNCNGDFWSQWQHGRSWKRPQDPSVKSGFLLEKQTEVFNRRIQQLFMSWMPDFLPLWNRSLWPLEVVRHLCCKKWPCKVEISDTNIKVTFLHSPKDPAGKVISSVTLECSGGLTTDMCLSFPAHSIHSGGKKICLVQKVSQLHD